MKRALALPLLFLIACGGGNEPQMTATAAAPPPPVAQPAPSADEAKYLIANSPEFSEYQFTNAAYTLPLQQSVMTTPALQVARDLRKAGWISFDGAGNVVLTSKAKSDKRFLLRQNGVVDIVPLARKEVTAVDLVGSGEQPIVDFRWEWVANEIGRVFGPKYSGEQHARATLLWDGSRWTVLRIEPAV